MIIPPFLLCGNLNETASFVLRHDPKLCQIKIQLMTTVLRQADEILRTVYNAATADAAARRLQSLLPLWDTTQQTRYHAAALSEQLTPAERLAIQMLDAATSRLIQTRRALHEQKWYGSTTLQTVDELLR